MAKDEEGNMKDMAKALKTRRRSTGNFSLGNIAQLFRGQESGGGDNLDVSGGDSIGDFTGEKRQNLTHSQ